MSSPNTKMIDSNPERYREIGYTCGAGYVTSAEEKEGQYSFPTAPCLDGTPFLDLGNGWALAADRHQWILNKAKNLHNEVKWQPEAFIATDTAVLKRVMREKGLQVPPDDTDAVNRFFSLADARFIDWRDKVKALHHRRAG